MISKEAYDKSVELCTQAVKLFTSGMVDEAIPLYEEAIKYHPWYALYWSNLGAAYLEKGEFGKARNMFDTALYMGFDLAAYHISELSLYQGNEWAYLGHKWASIAMGTWYENSWSGESLHKKKVLVANDQGHGDFIQHLRNIHWVREYGPASVDVAVMPCMQSLVKWYIEDLGFNVIYGVNTIKWVSKYADSKFHVGLCWKGNNDYGQDWKRSIHDENLLKPIVTMDNVVIHCLHQSEEISDFEKLAEHIAAVDVVISVDTAVAHLAGAMDKECWLILPWIPDPRWGLKGDRSRYYPSLRLFRQNKFKDWQSVIDNVAVELKNRIG